MRRREDSEQQKPGMGNLQAPPGVFPTFPYGAWCEDRRMTGSVLIVDDDPGFRRLAFRLLTNAGLTVVAEAADAREAVVAANAAKPDGILVDVGLPDRDGLELAHELV